MDTEQTELMNEESLPLENKMAEIDTNEYQAEESGEAEAVAKTWREWLPKNMASIVVSWVLVIAVLLCVGVLAQVLSKGYVSVAGFSLFRVVTGSMEPEIPVGSLIISKEVDIEQIEAGDIVNFKSKESGMLGLVITHRVIQVHEDSNGRILLETKGDANRYADGFFVEEANLIGKTVSYTKRGNLIAGILSLLTNKVGFLACIVVPCLMIGIYTMRDCVESLREEIDAVSLQLDEVKIAATSREPEHQLTETEYQALCERLRNELLEELKQGEEKITTEKPGEDHS